ncbi:MAG: hypothetical protein N2V73_08055 [Candidatus Methanospirare jalkutatii]|nr:hypothetical protein [Candidatus Methanospirare jalkutatii]
MNWGSGSARMRRFSPLLDVFLCDICKHLQCDGTQCNGTQCNGTGGGECVACKIKCVVALSAQGGIPLGIGEFISAKF